VNGQYRRSTLQGVLEDPAISLPDELEQAFRAQHRLVFRTAYRVTGSAADAEDVLQTVFLRLLRRDHHSGPLEDPESYLRRAAVNAALDVLRSRQTGATIPLSDETPARPQPDASLRQALARAIAQLKPRSAEIFTLRFIEGLSNQEIAEALGISQVLVAVIIHRARQQLRKQLRAYLGDKS